MAISRVYINQPFTLVADTNKTLAGGSLPKLLYRKPDGTTGSITGTASGTNITASVTGAINDTSGVWSWQASYLFSGDTNASLGDLGVTKTLNQWER